MQIAESKVWILVGVSISNNGNHFIMNTSSPSLTHIYIYIYIYMPKEKKNNKKTLFKNRWKWTFYPFFLKPPNYIAVSISFFISLFFDQASSTIIIIIIINLDLYFLLFFWMSLFMVTLIDFQ